MADEIDLYDVQARAAQFNAERRAEWQLANQPESAAAEIRKLRAELAAEREAHAALQARCYDGGGSQSVFDAVKEARAELAEKDQAIANAGEIIETMSRNAEQLESQLTDANDLVRFYAREIELKEVKSLKAQTLLEKEKDKVEALQAALKEANDLNRIAALEIVQKDKALTQAREGIAELRERKMNAAINYGAACDNDACAMAMQFARELDAILTATSEQNASAAEGGV
jgi:chromosome segregation ATPase